MSLPRASLLENARFNALVIVPNALQGIFRRRPKAVAAATKANVDGKAVGLLTGLKRGHSGGPVWVRVVRDPALLLLSAADVRRALSGSPDPFASDPAAKRDGMVTFQPDALTLSRGDEWRSRRGFTEHVLGTGGGLHQLAERFAGVVWEEVTALAATAGGAGTIGWDQWNDAHRRVSRRVILGDAAAGDAELSETLAAMMDEANGMGGETSEEYADFAAAIGRYIDAAEDGSLVSLFAAAPQDALTKVAGQVPHWLFASGDTLAANTLRAMAAILSHPEQEALVRAELDPAGADAADVDGLKHIEACLEEAMRLWPTTSMLSRVTLAETDWQGVSVPSGTQVLIPNTFLHRDRDRLDYADRFAPEEWTDGEAAGDWGFNHFSHGPQGCPGAALSLFLGKAFMAGVLRSSAAELRSKQLDPLKPMPHMFDYFGIRLAVSA